MQEWERDRLEKARLDPATIKALTSRKRRGRERDEGSRDADGRGDAKARKPEPESDLPVNKYRDEIVSVLHTRQVLIVCGETGSGKSTQLPQFLRQAGLIGPGNGVVVTQPRRVAAMSLAGRVAQEIGTPPGQVVGYSVRFDSKVSAATEIKFTTEGMLLREMMANPRMDGYGAVVIDEAHERTLDADVLFGLLGELRRVRPEFKIVISSATLDAAKFAAHFKDLGGGANDKDETTNGKDAPVIYVEGRTFPVEVLWAKEDREYEDAVVETVARIHQENPPKASGADPARSILVFLPGQAEIRRVEQRLLELKDSWGTRVAELITVPMHSGLSLEAQSQAFVRAPAGSRKVILATNIAETSLTIPDIRWVVDTGLVKLKEYDAGAGMDALTLASCSQASAKQRAGRAGRTGPGVCYRLYTKRRFATFATQTLPEIMRSNLSQVCLLLMSLGITDPQRFPWIDRPERAAVVRALTLLYSLGGVTSDAKLTKRGRLFAEFPTDPRMARSLLIAAQSSTAALRRVCAAAAMLGEQNTLYLRPKAEGDPVYAMFVAEQGDLHTLVKVYEAWAGAQYSARWCQQRLLDLRSLKRARSAFDQLLTTAQRAHRAMAAYAPGNQACQAPPSELAPDAALTYAIACGYFGNAARSSLDTHSFVDLETNQALYIHPSSTIWHRKPPPPLVLYTEVVTTSKEYMRTCTIISEEVLEKARTTYT